MFTNGFAARIVSGDFSLMAQHAQAIAVRQMEIEEHQVHVLSERGRFRAPPSFDNVANAVSLPVRVTASGRT
jgi:hypothetical protein